MEHLNVEQLLKVQQALPSFHAAQRELIFSTTPIMVEGSTDSAILLNVATKVDLPLGAAGVGVASMGGKTQLFAFRALLSSVAKTNARFILDLDAAIDSNVLHALDADPAVLLHLAKAGSGGRTLSQEAGELIKLLRQYVAAQFSAGRNVGRLTPLPDKPLTDRELGIALRVVVNSLERETPLPDVSGAGVIIGKLQLIRAAARAANVLILKKGPIEAYYASQTALDVGDFQKQQAFQAELDAIWNAADSARLEVQYAEILTFLREAGLTKAPVSEMALEPIADLVHLLQTEISAGKIKSITEAHTSSRAKAEGYWYICEITELQVITPKNFHGTIAVKKELGGAVIAFDENTRPFHIAMKKEENANETAIE